ncbi:PAS domain-containing hybrid sensor histidine kinase/response regulator [Aurantiacibacter zhengii]|uniref:histidine kinase n=1 Tax=Aurantiacibacter zhengii TaxID=2307003 RepID=A0A418NPK6_9SPHN|nr:PAS domain-containing hybrid sensor histidine kinase/response regulator [Aurantiacibacter zhengii]RIV83951.1 response regulator [Aurantiacibacter zhengii]
MVFALAVTLAAAYLGLLFWLATRRDRQQAEGSDRNRRGGWVYGLSLAVYCTSWTFFGGVGTAATQGLEFLPIFLGPILLFVLGKPLIRRVLLHAKAQHSTSIADFLSARYGKSGTVAALVSVIATLGSLPYMALQLQSVGASLLALDNRMGEALAQDELVLLVAAVMALFAILFGSRRGDRSGENAGLVFTIAVEAVVKLVALLAIALLALVLTVTDPASVSELPATFSLGQVDSRFWVLTLISACAVLCLPRQFHMTFVEARDADAGRRGYWIFPAYLALTAMLIVPIALAGTALLPDGTNPDMIVLQLPLATDHVWLAILAFIGGLSASTGMIIVASVALSTMITNDLVAPLVFRQVFRGRGDRTQLARQLLAIRRIVIASLLVLAYLFYLGFGGLASLADLGTLAFAAAAQFAPGLLFGIYTRRANRHGMVAGLVAGFAIWVALLIGPAALGTQPVVSVHSDPLVSGIALSLAANAALFWIATLLTRPNLVDEAQAAAFRGAPGHAEHALHEVDKRVADVRLLLAQFVGRNNADAAIAAAPRAYRDSDHADKPLLAMAERMVAGVIGSSSARLLMLSWAQDDPVSFAEVVAMFDETSRRLSFNADLLRVAIENIDQGVALVDRDMNLVAWNSRYQDMFGLPDDLVMPGTPIAQLIRFNLAESGVAPEEIERQVARRIGYMKEGTRHRAERTQADGRVMRILGNPAPGGGYVTSYTDITADRLAEQALEEKVAQRTAQLREANAALEQATRSKTRFLAAASHDLIQPLNAARLFASALGEEVAGQDGLERLVRNLDGSIAAADRLIRALLDISKLDGGGIEPQMEQLALAEIVADLKREFAIQAAAKGIDLRCLPTSAIVESDRALLLSILRNLVSNAIRYTPAGKVLVGVKRCGDEIRLCVIDTGPGIDPDDRERIFGEFQRASRDGEGLGLGLAIAKRAARLLGVPIELQSRVGSGSAFALRLRVAKWSADTAPVRQPARSLSLGHASVLVIDNDPAALAATSALLGKWQLRVTGAASADEALAHCPEPPDVVIVDYQLDDGVTGDAAYRSVTRQWGAKPPAIMLTAQSGEETRLAAASIAAHRLLKPSPPAALRALLAEAVSRSKAQDVQDDPVSTEA